MYTCEQQKPFLGAKTSAHTLCYLRRMVLFMASRQIEVFNEQYGVAEVCFERLQSLKTNVLLLLLLQTVATVAIIGLSLYPTRLLHKVIYTMQLLSTLAFVVLAVQCVLASPERKLLRSGYDTPINFSDLSDLTSATGGSPVQHGLDKTLPSTNSISKGGLLPSTDSLSSVDKGDVLPSANSLPIGDSSSNSVGKNVVPTDLTTLAGRSGLPSLPSLPTGIGGDTGASKGSSKGVSGIIDGLSGITSGVGVPSTSTTSSKKGYTSVAKGSQPEDRTLQSPKKNLPPSPNKQSSKKTSTKPSKASQKKKTKPTSKNSHKPNQKRTPKPDPEKSPVQRPVV